MCRSNNIRENPKFYILWGPQKNGLKSGKFKIWETLFFWVFWPGMYKKCVKLQKTQGAEM
jgi:hypothetical protein